MPTPGSAKRCQSTDYTLYCRDKKANGHVCFERPAGLVFLEQGIVFPKHKQMFIRRNSLGVHAALIN